jgi:hypothetical protein
MHCLHTSEATRRVARGAPKPTHGMPTPSEGDLRKSSGSPLRIRGLFVRFFTPVALLRATDYDDEILTDVLNFLEDVS